MKKRIFRFFFLCARLHTLTHRIQTTHPLTSRFSTLFQFYRRLHFTPQTTQRRFLPNFATPVKIWKKQQEAAGSNTRPDYLHRRRLRSRSGKTLQQQDTNTQTTPPQAKSPRLHTAEQQQEQTTLNVPLQQQEGRLQEEQQQERGRRKQRS